MRHYTLTVQRRLGNLRWVEALQWSGSPLSPELDWLVLGQKAGTVRTSGPLSFVKVHDAGHMVPMVRRCGLRGRQKVKRFTQGCSKGGRCA